MRLDNTIVSGNPASGPPNCVGIITSLNTPSYNLSSSNDSSPTFTFRNTDPKLRPLADNGGATCTHALMKGSPAIDAIPVPTVATDQRGVARAQTGPCNIGAYDLGITTPKVTFRYMPTQVFINEDFSFEVTLANTGTEVGFGPFVDLVLPAAGIDGMDPNYGNPCDGISFTTTTPGPTLEEISTPSTLKEYFVNPKVPFVNLTPPGQMVSIPHPYAESLVPVVKVVDGEQLLRINQKIDQAY